MANFRYAAYDRSGSIERGEIEARSRADAVAALTARGLTPFESAEVKEALRGGPSLRTGRPFGRLGLKHYAEFTRTLSVLLAADLPLDTALRLLLQQTESAVMRNFTERLLAEVTAGKLLSAALASIAPDAPTLAVNLLRAGEARGHVAPALADLADFFEARVEMTGQIRSALTYPLILCIMAIGAMAIIIIVLVPALMPLFTDSGVVPPLTLRVASALGEMLTVHAHLIGGIAIASLALSALLLRRPGVQSAIAGAMFKAPIIGSLVRRTNTALFARTLGTLLHHGVSLLPALEIAAAVVPNRAMGAAIALAAERVKEGQRLTDALDAAGSLPDLALRFIAIGEEASKIDQMLLHLAALTEKAVQRDIGRAMTLLSPVLTIAIGGLIGGLFMSVLQAMLSINQVALR